VDMVYKKVEVVGTSETSFSDAVKTAIQRASETIRDIRWFEVTEMRGAVENGAIRQYQVTVKIGFRVMPAG
jgi:flavin-binding protein dodecin